MFQHFLCAGFYEHIFKHSILKMKMTKVPQKTYWLIIFVLVVFLGSGCSKWKQLIGFTKDSTAPASCADRVIERAFNLHEDAKSGLALYFEERSDNQLFQAFYAAADSVYESRKVKTCWDRRRSHYNALRNLYEINTALAWIIRRNMPDDDRGEMISVFRDQYDWLMPNYR